MAAINTQNVKEDGFTFAVVCVMLQRYKEQLQVELYDGTCTNCTLVYKNVQASGTVSVSSYRVTWECCYR